VHLEYFYTKPTRAFFLVKPGGFVTRRINEIFAKDPYVLTFKTVFTPNKLTYCTIYFNVKEYRWHLRGMDRIEGKRSLTDG
jgi:hypothetical protein